jgi:4a-hydroxytetrahydrobiopterin dehydratase
MASRTRLDPDAVAERLRSRPEWELRDGRLHREMRFDDFVGAFRFMSGVALHAEKLDHHPDWSNVYNQVTIDLHTHDAGGITELDFELAARIDRLTD